MPHRARKNDQRPGLTETAAMEALKARGFTQETIEFFYIAPDIGAQAWRYPIRDFNGQVAAVRFKAFSNSGQANNWWPEKGQDSRRFPIYTDWSRIEGDVMLTAGEPDLWTAWQLGFPAMTFLHGEGDFDSPGRVLETLRAMRILKGLQEVTIVRDNDQKGQEGASQWKTALKRMGLTVHILRLPNEVAGQPIKDLNDALVVLNGDTAALKGLLAAQMDGRAFERDEAQASDHWAVETATTIRQRSDPVPPWLAEGIMRQGELAVAVASGQPFLGRFPIEASGPVFIVQEEVHPAFYSRRIRGATEGLAQEVTDRILVWSRKGLVLDTGPMASRPSSRSIAPSS